MCVASTAVPSGLAWSGMSITAVVSCTRVVEPESVVLLSGLGVDKAETDQTMHSMDSIATAIGCNGYGLLRLRVASADTEAEALSLGRKGAAASQGQRAKGGQRDAARRMLRHRYYMTRRPVLTLCTALANESSLHAQDPRHLALVLCSSLHCIRGCTGISGPLMGPLMERRVVSGF